MEEALYDSATLRQFVGIDLGAEPVPDETTVCNTRRQRMRATDWGRDRPCSDHLRQEVFHSRAASLTFCFPCVAIINRDLPSI